MLPVQPPMRPLHGLYLSLCMCSPPCVPYVLPHPPLACPPPRPLSSYLHPSDAHSTSGSLLPSRLTSVFFPHTISLCPLG